MSSAFHSRANLYWFIVIVGLGIVAIALIFLRRDGESGWVAETEEAEEQLPKSFDGVSEALRQTVIVPTLDTPFEKNQSAIWCSSFQLSWNKFKSEIIKGPVRIQNAETIAERLNQAEQSESDLLPESFYAAAGRVSDGIVEKIKEEMTKRFPNVRTPEFNVTPDAAVAYAYLQAGVKYQYPFFTNTDRFVFTDSSGRKTAVKSFGIREQDKFKGAFMDDSFRGQVLVLGKWRNGEQFAVDLSKRSTPIQIVLACIERQSTLANTLKSLEKAIQAGYADKTFPRKLEDEDTLLVPMMHWEIEHHFRDLEGPEKVLSTSTGQKLYLAKAFQLLEFKMDEKGAEITSEAMEEALDGGPAHYHFDRPYLIYLKKRSAKHPFFVMWVDNAELLSKP